MKLTNLLISITIASMITVGAMAQTQKLTTTVIKSMTASKSYNQVSIHDPSIVYNSSDKKYYIVGSHIGVGSSSDLINWSGFNTGTEHSAFFNKSYKTAFSSCPKHAVQVMRNGSLVTDTLKSFDAGAFCSTYAEEGVDWISGDMWAPDIVYNPNMKKWCLYLSLNGDYWASIIVLMTADKPTGPFTYQAPIVFGGFNNVSHTISGTSRKVDIKNTDMSIVTGSTTLPTRFSSAGSKWGTYYPNCIDPCSFFDEDGELWLAYGSWSGGIWMLKLDKNTGLRDYTTTYSGVTLNANATSDQYYGKKIAGGYYVSGEGPYIQHIGDYYYLFMSYGGFAPDGGYEMRVFRSSTPDGTYKDASGNTATYTGYAMNYGPKATTNRGMKLLGAMNDWGTMTVGECAEGHNSVCLDPDGNAFLCYHTKFNDGTAGHLVRVRQLFVNEKGWLVASPFRYTGLQTTQAQIDSTRLFTEEEIAGTYNFLLHPYKLDYANFEEATPVKITLSADGNITGDKTGTWSFSEDGKSYIQMKIGGVIYYGVAMNQKVDGLSDMPAVCLTCVSNGGVPVWAYKYAPKAAVANAYTPIYNYIHSTITGDAPIPENVSASFTCKNYTTKEPEPETVSEDGKFTPTTDGHKVCFPSPGVKVWCGDYYFTLISATGVATAISEKIDTAKYYPVSTYKNTTSAWWKNFSTKDYTLNPGEVAHFKFYNYSNKAANYKNWCLYGANVTHGATGYTEYFGIRNDNWDNTSGSNTGCTSDFNWSTFTSDMDGSLIDMTVSYTASGEFEMKSTITTTSGKVYTYSFKKTLSAKPASIVLFFVNEGSYIDGTKFAADVNCDGTVDISDVNAIISVICGDNTTGFNADVNGDGTVDISDVNAAIGIICGD